MKQIAVVLITMGLMLGISVSASAQKKAELDSIKNVLASKDDSAPVTMGDLRDMSEVLFYEFMKAGHKQFVSMPRFAPKGKYKELATTTAAALATANEASQNLADLQEQVNEVQNKIDQVVENVQKLRVGTQNPTKEELKQQVTALEKERDEMKKLIEKKEQLQKEIKRLAN